MDVALIKSKYKLTSLQWLATPRNIVLLLYVCLYLYFSWTFSSLNRKASPIELLHCRLCKWRETKQNKTIIRCRHFKIKTFFIRQNCYSIKIKLGLLSPVSGRGCSKWGAWIAQFIHWIVDCKQSLSRIVVKRGWAGGNVTFRSARFPARSRSALDFLSLAFWKRNCLHSNWIVLSTKVTIYK